MIYVFDDNLSKRLSEDFFKKIASRDFVKFHSSTIPIEEVNTNEIHCIMFHDSFPDNEFKNNIVNIAKKNNIPLVFFSNQYTRTEFDFLNGQINGIKAIKKDRFYNNLFDFLDEYKLNNKADFEILAYSKNYALNKAPVNIDLIKNSIILYRTFRYDDVFSINSDSKQSEEYKALKELFYFCYNGEFQKYLDEFENKFIDKDVTPNEIALAINNIKNKIIEKYE